MSNLIPQVSVKIPNGVLCNITDLGDYYAVGNNILKKDLTLAQLTQTFTINHSTGASVPLAAFAYYDPSLNKASLLNLRGSGAQVQGYELVASSTNYTTSNAAAFIDDSIFSNYLDSSMGVSAGKRILAVGTYNSVSIGYVQPAGNVNWLSVSGSVSYTWLGARTLIVGESNNYVYVISYVSVSIGASSTVCQISKATGVTTSSFVMDVQHYIKYLGITDDHKMWFCTYNKGYSSAVTNMLQYHVVDFVTDQMWQSAAVAGLHTNNTYHNGTYTPTALTLNAADNTNYKMYTVNDPKLATGSLTVKMAMVPKAGKTLAASFVAPTFATCTLTDAPAIGVFYTDLSVENTYTGQVNSWLFNDAGNEYLAIAYHSSIDPSSTYFIANNKCPPSKHAIYVFKVDPTNPLNLIYKSTLTNDGFGSSQTLPMLVKTADGKTLVAANSQGFTVISWNHTTEGFFNGPWNGMAILNVHLDHLDQLWIRDYSENLYLFSPTASNNIVVNFATESVNYTGTPVSTNVLCSSYDLKGARQITSVTLVVSGAVFTATNSTQVTVTTSTTGDVLVPITISSVGGVTVTPVL